MIPQASIVYHPVHEIPQSNVQPQVLLRAVGVSTSRPWTTLQQESKTFYCLIPDSRPDEPHRVAGLDGAVRVIFMWSVQLPGGDVFVVVM